MATYGDFIGFSFNGVHSSDLGIIRVSDGSRYNENLLPTFTDKTTQVAGVNETYYFYTNETQKQFTVNFAFDSLTEVQLRNLRQKFAPNIYGELIFDELPYKAWTAKLTGTPIIKYICFEENNARKYKGEGTLNFISYYPYAHSVHKWLNQYSNSNKNEWKASSWMKQSSYPYDQILKNQSTDIDYFYKLYNPGDVPTDFLLSIYMSSFNNLTIQLQYVSHITENIAELTLGSISRQSTNDTFLVIDSRQQLILGAYQKDSADIRSLVYTGTIYNQFITSGDFFKIPQHISLDPDLILHINSYATANGFIDYKYLYR